MTLLAALPPLPVVAPLCVAGLLLAANRLLPKLVPDVVALATALAVCGSCVVLAMHSAAEPIVYWFGGWAPRAGLPLGIGFMITPVGAAVAAFVAFLFACALVFAWGYYDGVHAHFHVLMLLFMAGMVGFCLTHDLFNMFVWFEVMSVAGFALTGYQLRTAALESALNFTIVNTLGSYFFLGGLGLIYARFGMLDFSGLGHAAAAAPHGLVVQGAFLLLSTGLLIKGAQVPFHFWLSDAHSVAPSPVSVIFSGAMVALGLYGVAELLFAVFSSSPEICAAVRLVLLPMGAVTAVLGGLMALLQRHVKRLLAFSTISHAGIMLIGISLLDRPGLAGMLVYLLGHGLVKGALFMLAGILLATKGGIDEILLRGAGRDMKPVGVAMAAGGLLLAGLPVGMLRLGTDFIGTGSRGAEHVLLSACIVLGCACTGGAVLRAAGRIFWGFGDAPGPEEAQAPTARDEERSARPVWLMLAPAVLMLALSLALAGAASDFLSAGTLGFLRPQDAAILGTAPWHGTAWWALPRPAPPPGPVISTLGAIAIAGFSLFRRRLPTAAFDAVANPVAKALNVWHSGEVGDYTAWIAAGLALFVLGIAFA